MIIIPAIDIIGGKAVRLTQGDYGRKTEYADNPATVAKQFEAAGLKNLHVVDLEGAKASQPVNLQTLQEITSQTTLNVDFGGGVKSDESIQKVFAAGAQHVTAGSIAVKNKPLVKSWIDRYGAEKIILGADVQNEKIAINGWQEDSGLDLFEFLEEYIEMGVTHTICTDVSKDGLLQGPAFDLYRKIQEAFPNLKLIASGGVSSLADLKALKEMGVYGTIVGKAYYEGRISLEELAALENQEK
ncbi:1-(5-phosphoribosyl)-5-[(5-phosphoribosylamino)methylideneamino]imidazole-4-carboxamide isomerase [Roseivirga misakiensis]|uniref:1-(5-phosphoribosyl)-5-[(5-phosphoribosylamino)methylideneamino] imidazole-4-carboxamide isomerase n=1 Tax=Roseivirga misakiensis TaxID=1563681 RepID=A0A1E5T174_9BACT|nr:1-(5-phosphoribosyl)-5-[(5-phosphoribosylamino)methylideneamino]imidazole-4-carboxamide isomerase [Roseivirga misakiensis]OEK05111.1 1-(5-phosphoribosyl)-5-[(5-phosphoribosylamino)methylideneamino]imidazole-4-carboxamide isomerase [Roseivirga misakiensis]